MQQSQESLLDQLWESVVLCNRNGLYDAADYIKNKAQAIEDRIVEKYIIGEDDD